MKTSMGERSRHPISSEPNVATDRLLTIREVSALTNLSVGTLYHFVSAKRITVVRLSKRCIRFRYSDLLTWIETHTEGIVGPERRH
jgi:excisionase family DNA binding protein